MSDAEYISILEHGREADAKRIAELAAENARLRKSLRRYRWQTAGRLRVVRSCQRTKVG